MWRWLPCVSLVQAYGPGVSCRFFYQLFLKFWQGLVNSWFSMIFFYCIIAVLGECPKLCRGASSCLMPVCHSQVLKTDHSSHIQWVLFSRRNALAHRFLLLSDMFLILWCMLLSSAYFVQNAGGYNVTIGIRSMFGKKGNFGPRLVSLILHLAACSSLLSLFSLFSLISLSLSLSSLLSLLCLSASLLSLFSLSLSLVSCLFSLIFLLFLFFLLSLSLSPPLLSWGMSWQGVKTYNFGTSSGTSSDTSSETLMWFRVLLFSRLELGFWLCQARSMGVRFFFPSSHNINLEKARKKKKKHSFWYGLFLRALRVLHSNHCKHCNHWRLHFQVSVPIGIAIWGNFCLLWGKSLCHAGGFCLRFCSCICLKLGFRSVPFGKCIWNIEITYWFVLFEAVSLHVNRTIERLKPLKNDGSRSVCQCECLPGVTSVCPGVTRCAMRLG